MMRIFVAFFEYKKGKGGGFEKLQVDSFSLLIDYALVEEKSKHAIISKCELLIVISL